VSIGIAVYPLDANSLNELIEKSDNSLYKAKRDGKNRVYTYSK
jgi:diguanylate cyclase (GGDEF)-like protein